MKVGDYVRLVVPHDRKQDAFARGRITATEQYTDFHNTRTWLYVQWFDHDGKPDKDCTKHARQELYQVPCE